MIFKDVFNKFYEFFRKINTENKKLIKYIKNIILILVGSFMFMILWVNRINFLPENIILWTQGKIFSIGFMDSFPCALDGEKVLSKNFQIYDKNIFALSDTSLNILNSKGKINPEDIPKIISEKNRALAGPTAPAHGLYLNKIFY